MDNQMQQQLASLRQELGGKDITQENMQELEQKKREIKQMQDEMLAQICTPEAVQRLKTVGMVKPDVSAKVQSQLLGMAQSGRLGSRVDENRLKSLLEQVGSTTKKATTVTIQRKRNPMFDDDDSDDNDDDLR